MKKLTPEQAKEIKEHVFGYIEALGMQNLAAIERFFNNITQGPILRQSYTPDDLYELAGKVDSVFSWEETTQGESYWCEVQSNLLELAELAELAKEQQEDNN